MTSVLLALASVIPVVLAGFVADRIQGHEIKTEARIVLMLGGMLSAWVWRFMT
jgi:hypothetical protein